MEFKRSQPRKVPFKQFIPDYSKDKDIVEYQVIDTVEKTGDGESDFIVVKKVVEVSRKNRQAFYDEQAKGHTIYGLIALAETAGDLSVMHTGSEGLYGDYSKMPLDRADWYANKEAVEKALAQLDPALVGDDLLKFLKEVTPEDVAAFYKAKQEKKPETEGGAE